MWKIVFLLLLVVAFAQSQFDFDEYDLSEEELEGLRDWFNRGKAASKDFANKVKNVVKKGVDKVKSSDAFKKVKNVVKKGVDKVKSSDAFKKVKNGVKKGVDKFKSSDALKKVKDVLGLGVDQLKKDYEKAKKFWEEKLEPLRKLLRSYYKKYQALGTKYRKDIRGKSKRVRATLKEAWYKARKKVQEKLMEAHAASQKVLDKLKNLKKEKIEEFLAAELDSEDLPEVDEEELVGLGNFVKNLVDKGKDAAKGGVNKVKKIVNGGKDVAKVIKNAATGLFDKVDADFEKIKTGFAEKKKELRKFISGLFRSFSALAKKKREKKISSTIFKKVATTLVNKIKAFLKNLKDLQKAEELAITKGR